MNIQIKQCLTLYTIKAEWSTKTYTQGFPGGAAVKNPPANSGDTEPGFEPWSGKIPHAAEQLSPWATTTEPALQSPQATTPEARAPGAHALQQEKPPQ